MFVFLNREQERDVLEQQIAALKASHVEESKSLEDLHSKNAEELNETLEDRARRLEEMEER
jgi:cell division protein FtsB